MGSLPLRGLGSLPAAGPGRPRGEPLVRAPGPQPRRAEQTGCSSAGGGRRGPGRSRRLPVAGEAVRGSRERVKGRWRGRPAVGSEHVQIATASILLEGRLVGVLAIGQTHLVQKRRSSETARDCWRQPGQPTDAVNQELAKKHESSRIP
ncbi:transmembrane protein 229B isoform X2 [Colius striatus]|uniref:transmembrane protein 229B isoform X2 n=1 Tax=Colius striatus TaxID=57412 RepID=UPI002B1D4F93|nr:transmembrane protein 229B isoform X2 [Colius striatus]